MSDLDYKWDSVRDVMTIEGKEYSGELFRSWGDKGMFTGIMWLDASKKGGPIEATVFPHLTKEFAEKENRRLADETPKG